MRKEGFLLARYLIAIVLSFALPLFYLIFRPITMFPVYLFFKITNGAMIIGNSIIVNNISIEFIDACIAGSAYLLFLILNIITPMRLKQRILSISFGFLLLLLFNIVRIIILILLILNNSAVFDITHEIFWHFISTIFIVAIWIASIFLFHIKGIPAYSDIKFLIEKIKR